MKIRLDGVTKSFGNRVAVDNLSLEMRKGQILGLLGPNGSGKTTSIKMLTGELSPTKGKILYDDKVVDGLHRLSYNDIGIMPQEIIIWDHLTLIENLRFSATLFRMSNDMMNSRIEYLLEKLHLGAEKNALAKNLSGGYKRRLHLAISIIHDPKIIFLDEPTPGIDPQSRRAMWDFINELKKTGEYAILLTDHYLDEAEKVCDYLVIIDGGKLIAEGTMKDLQKGYGNGKFITVDLLKLDEDFNRDVQQRFSKAITHNDKLSIPTNNPEIDISVLLNLIDKHSIKFDDISIKEPSLEDIFLLLTGKEIRS